MIERSKLLTDLQAVLRILEADLLERSDLGVVPGVGERLRLEYQQAKQAERTAQSYAEWQSDYITHVAAAWVLSAVFTRFLEDNQLIEPPTIAGVGERLQRARDEHEVYFRSHPTETDREYLLHIFDKLAKLPGAKDVFGEHNSIHELPDWLSGDAAGELLKFFQRIYPETGLLIHDFTDPNWDTRFLGDLYQDLSERARKKYALLQTPEFVEEFILDRTLDPAIDEFGLEDFRMIDPACGSGHFLLGSFHRLLERWQRKEPATNVRVLAQRALDSIHGVDVNPYAVVIARFRLLLAAMWECHITRLADAPAFRFNLACGDSLLHGIGNQLLLGDWAPMAHHFRSEDASELNRILVPEWYHAVVANPPYITPKDAALNAEYRKRYSACHRQYSLAVPFMERIFQLAIDGGYTGQITANSFMKREFGKKLIEEFIPKIDLTHVIDTSGAYIPGHSTPTVILFGRNRKPVVNTIRTVMSIRGEPGTPNAPTRGLVWSSILSQVDQLGSQSEFISVANSSREPFHKHPWSIGGGGAAELREWLENGIKTVLSSHITEVGRTTHTGEDDVFSFPLSAAKTTGLTLCAVPLILGENMRDYLLDCQLVALFPYDKLTGVPLETLPDDLTRHFWRYRVSLKNRRDFGQTIEERGLRWFDHSMFFANRYRTPLSIVFAFVATHNHFVLDRGGKVFNRSIPVIKLPANSTEEEHLALLGLLNSSTACFWGRQTFFPKGGFAAGKWEERLEWDGTKLLQFPLPANRPLALTQRLDELSQQMDSLVPASVINSHWSVVEDKDADHLTLRRRLTNGYINWQAIRSQMISLQEELDWQCYQLYGLINKDLTSSTTPPPIKLGQRAFEIVMARKMAVGEIETTWFERHGSTPITELSSDWSDDYKQLVERRIELIETNRNIGLIEQPEYKRRWNTESWESQLERALRNWLLDRLESYFDFDGRMNDEGKPTAKTDISLISIAKLADIARQDADFMQVGELYRNDAAFNVQKLVMELVESESVPLLPVLRYKPSGLRKRVEWEHTWELQRQEDAIDARTKLLKDDPDYLDLYKVKELKRHKIGDIPVPPKYTSSDFQSQYWRLRGKLDVPKERWVSFPYCEDENGTLTIAWAGYDHLQLASAISAYYVDVQERLGGWDDSRLLPLLAGLLELLSWLKQWHNDLDPTYNLQMGDYYEGFIQDEARQLGRTLEQIRAWEPPQRTSRRRA